MARKFYSGVSGAICTRHHSRHPEPRGDRRRSTIPWVPGSAFGGPAGAFVALALVLLIGTRPVHNRHMEHNTLITTLVAAIVLAFVFGFAAQRLKLSPLVGYLLAGVAVGPYTPGFEANIGLALQLSEIGIILLMFGVGLKISVEDIWAVRWVSIPGSLLQTLLVALLGTIVGLAFDMPIAEASLLGLTLSVASTIVFFRMLEERRLMKTEEGRIGVSWLLVEDLLIVLAIVVLPALAAALHTVPPMDRASAP